MLTSILPDLSEFRRSPRPKLDSYSRSDSGNLVTSIFKACAVSPAAIKSDCRTTTSPMTGVSGRTVGSGLNGGFRPWKTREETRQRIVPDTKQSQKIPASLTDGRFAPGKMDVSLRLLSQRLFWEITAGGNVSSPAIAHSDNIFHRSTGIRRFPLEFGEVMIR